MFKPFVFAVIGGLAALSGQSVPASPAPQTAAVPADASSEEKAVRARASEFLQYHVDGTFSKAMALVAEETKEAYFAAGKIRLKAFKIDSVRFSENNTKATVIATVTRDWQIRVQTTTVTVPMTTSWKIENGQWVWYWDPSTVWTTPMGGSPAKDISRNPDGSISIPVLSQENINAKAQSVLMQSNLDKSEFVFDLMKSTEQRAIFYNGASGMVRAGLDGIPNIPGFTAKLENTDVAANAKVAVILSYSPPSDAEELPEPFTLRVVTEPMNQSFPIRVKFEK